MGNRLILITTLAAYQTRFWLKVGLRLQQQGEQVMVLSFDDRSCELLAASGLPYVNIPEAARRSTVVDAAAVFQQFALSDLNYWTSHHRITYGIGDAAELDDRLARYLGAVDQVLADLLAQRRATDVVVVQELGGFLSVLATWFAARNRSLTHYFLEPSFFRGRLFSLKNVLTAPQIPDQPESAVSPTVRAYLDAAIANQTIVIPQKDTHQYTAAFAKVFNRKNVARGLQKLVDKYLLRKHQEFGYIGHYVLIHLRMLVNTLRMRGHYTPLTAVGEYLYFPFHVPGDVALTLRSPQYLDQLALVEYLVRIVPRPWQIVVKEHPAQIGAVPAGRLKALLRQYDNLHVIEPGTNNYQVLGRAGAIISINSKSGAEAAMLGKPVLVLGDAFYKDSPLVIRVRALQDLPTALTEALGQAPTPEETRYRYFQRVWDQTHPGELYVEGDAEVATFSDSLVRIVDGQSGDGVGA